MRNPWHDSLMGQLLPWSVRGPLRLLEIRRRGDCQMAPDQPVSEAGAPMPTSGTHTGEIRGDSAPLEQLESQIHSACSSSQAHVDPAQRRPADVQTTRVRAFTSYCTWPRSHPRFASHATWQPPAHLRQQDEATMGPAEEASVVDCVCSPQSSQSDLTASSARSTSMPFSRPPPVLVPGSPHDQQPPARNDGSRASKIAKLRRQRIEERAVLRSASNVIVRPHGPLPRTIIDTIVESGSPPKQVRPASPPVASSLAPLIVAALPAACATGSPRKPLVARRSSSVPMPRPPRSDLSGAEGGTQHSGLVPPLQLSVLPQAPQLFPWQVKPAVRAVCMAGSYMAYE